MKSTLHASSGFSLLESLLALAILSSLVWLGLSLFHPERSEHRLLKSEAHRLEVFIQEAHTHAVILNTPLSITPVNPRHWSDGLVLQTLNTDATLHSDSRSQPQKILAHFDAMKPPIQLTYQGFPLSQSLVFYPTPTLQNSNGRFTLRARKETLSLILNKAGQLAYAS